MKDKLVILYEYYWFGMVNYKGYRERFKKKL